MKHHSPVVGTQPVNNNFQLACVHAHNLNADLPPRAQASQNFFGIVDSIQVVLDTLAGAPSPTKVTIRLCEDAGGDITIIPDTEADLALGLTTATIGCAVFKAQTLIRQDLGTANGTLFLFVKVDQGTARFLGSEIFWQE
jgi:hypothetical protein